jgi:hypothetical protein
VAVDEVKEKVEAVAERTLRKSFELCFKLFEISLPITAPEWSRFGDNINWHLQTFRQKFN